MKLLKRKHQISYNKNCVKINQNVFPFEIVVDEGFIRMKLESDFTSKF